MRLHLTITAGLHVAVLVASVTSAAPLPSWRHVWSYDSPLTGPTRRAHHTAVTIGDSMVVFGGHSSNYELLGDTWRFDFNMSTWDQIMPMGGVEPGPRAGHSSAVSYQNDEQAEMLMFGGLVPDASYHQRGASKELWSLRVVQDSYSWKLLKPQGEAPNERWGATLVPWERAQRVILFGGLSVVPREQLYLSQADLWMYDIQLSRWKQLLATGQTPLQGRFSHAACLVPGRALDGFDDRLVIYGGDHSNEGGTTTLGDLWTLHLGTMQWDCMACDNLFERSEHSMVSKGGRIFAFGGYSVQNSPSVFSLRNFPVIRYVFNDLLVGDLANDEWYEFLSDHNPSNRFALSAVLWRDEVVIYGGVMERHAKDMYALKLDESLDSQLVVASKDLPYFPMPMVMLETTNLLMTMLALMSVGSFLALFFMRRQARYERAYQFDFEDEEGGNVFEDAEVVVRRRKSDGLPPDVIDGMAIVKYEPGSGAADGPSGEACAVCLVDFAEDEELRVLHCLHRYHKECVDPWLMKSRLCPMCKRPAVDEETLETIRASEEISLEDRRRDSGMSEEEILLAEREDAWHERSLETGFILTVLATV